jgi:hypothetical protein
MSADLNDSPLPEATTLPDSASAELTPDLSLLVIHLLKGVIYREANGMAWSALLKFQSQVRDYVAVLALELVLDEAEGYAFLRARQQDDDSAAELPRLVARRPLSFSVSLLLALLRKKLTEFDASGTDTRLVLSLDEIVEIMRVFLPTQSNDSRLFDQIESNVNKVIDLGFLRKLKVASDSITSTSTPASYEVKRILKAFVDAQWLHDFDQRLAAYHEQALTTQLENDENMADESEQVERGAATHTRPQLVSKKGAKVKPAKSKSKARR